MMNEENLAILVLFLTISNADGLVIDLPKQIEIFEYDNLVLQCNISGYDQANDLVTFYWMKSESLIQSNQTCKIPYITRDQSGLYFCYVIINKVLYNSSTDVIVLYPPSWVQGKLRKFSGEIGASAQLKCFVDAYPSPAFVWTDPKNNSLPTSTSKYLIESTFNSSMLTINSITNSDYGTYSCEARNSAGKGPYTLRFIQPGIPDGPQLCQTINVTSNSFQMTCRTGYKGGVENVDYLVMISGSKLSSIQAASTYKMSNEGDIVIITVSDLTPKQDYVADVYARNKYGRSAEAYSVFVSTNPGPVVMTTGSMDTSKTIAVAVSVPIIGIALIAAVNAGVYYYYMKQKKNSPKSNIGTSRNVSSSFAANRLRRLSNSKEEILNESNHSSLLNSRGQRNFGYVEDQTPAKEHQPSLAGCGALQSLQIPLSSVSPSFVFLPGRSDDYCGSGTDGAASQRMPRSITLHKPKSKPLDDSWEFPRDKLYLVKKIGDGSFGEVWEGRMEDVEQAGGERKLVAVKMLRDNFTDDEKQCMMNEMEIMKATDFHQNVIQLIGCCTTSYPLCLIMEHATQGTLLNLLRQQRLTTSDCRLTTKNVESFTLQIASAMEYTSSLNLIHRDLAARSILMTDELSCKLSDFERAQHFEDGNNPQKKGHRIQIRWLPPESLFVMERSTKSNVWSFGILVWECLTLGSTPYPGMNNKEVVDFVQRGGRMPKPNFCSQAMYEVVQDCWVYYPHKRPTFGDLVQRISKVHEYSPIQHIDFATGECDSKSWNASPLDLGEFI